MPTLAQWLDRIQALHPKEIDLGLKRVREVARRLGVCRPAPLVITVAGTNGKGSTVAMLDAILRASGRRVGTCTSPHLHVYNERVGLHGQPATDAQLCAAFDRIEAERGDISLTYFEYSTLAGLWLIAQEQVDVAVLEIGLGGRLDAINLVDPDIAIITSIGLDHMEWLGDTREAIGREKAGILRAATPTLCGDLDPPVTILEEARRLGAPLRVQGVDFGFEKSDVTWRWWGRDGDGASLAWNDLPVPELDLLNAATVLQALQCLALPPSRECVCAALDGLGLQGRYQRIEDSRHGAQLRVDVAHNPHAAQLLLEKLRRFRQQAGTAARVHVVLAMMADKDQLGFHKALESAVDFWYIAAFAETRGLSAQALFELLQAQGAQVLGPHASVAQAYEHAMACAAESDLVLVTGSFVTVADVVRHVHAAASNPTPSDSVR
jgi:dihydrofolate synthase/folylpolyglutamate synthase